MKRKRNMKDLTFPSYKSQHTNNNKHRTLTKKSHFGLLLCGYLGVTAGNLADLSSFSRNISSSYRLMLFRPSKWFYQLIYQTRKGVSLPKPHCPHWVTPELLPIGIPEVIMWIVDGAQAVGSQTSGQIHLIWYHLMSCPLQKLDNFSTFPASSAENVHFRFT